MIVIYIIWIMWISEVSAASELDRKIPEDALLNFTDLVKKFGHPAEEYSVVTDDGYILKLFHLPGESMRPVFIMHGLGDSSDSYVIRGQKSLAISLANKGYDVWLGNNRGNKHSRKHINLNPDKDKEFWQFSFHEIGVYDLKAMVDCVLNKTDSDTLDVVAHSQGTTAFFALLATKPEYNEKINVLAALGPVAFVAHLTPPLSTIALAGPIINQVLTGMNVEEIAANGSAAAELRKRLCSSGFVGENICRFGIIFPMFGFDPRNLEADFVPVALSHFPSGFSRKCVLHYDQLFFSKRFASFDYGPSKNLEMYRSFSPPDYDLKRVTARVALFLGKNDPFAKIKDAEEMRKILSNLVFYHVMRPILWTHADFLWAIDMDKYLFPLIYDLFEKYE